MQQNKRETVHECSFPLLENEASLMNNQDFFNGKIHPILHAQTEKV